MSNENKKLYQNNSYNIDGVVLNIEKERSTVEAPALRGKVWLTDHRVYIDDEMIYSGVITKEPMTDLEVIEGMLFFVNTDFAKKLIIHYEAVKDELLQRQPLFGQSQQDIQENFEQMTNDYNQIIGILKYEDFLKKAVEYIKAKEAEKTESQTVPQGPIAGQ